MSLNRTHLWYLLAFALVLRLLSFGDVSVDGWWYHWGSYGEMARLMVETGNWLTPQFDYGILFGVRGLRCLLGWVRLALSFWVKRVCCPCSRIGWQVSRQFYWSRIWHKSVPDKSALVAAVVLATCGIFSIAAGAVMTDVSANFIYDDCDARVLFVLAGRKAVTRPIEIGDISVSLGIRFTCKRPCGRCHYGYRSFSLVSITTWLLWCFQSVMATLPTVVWIWVWCRAIALPWYIMAEMATPGFIDYFIVGEHLSVLFWRLGSLWLCTRPDTRHDLGILDSSRCALVDCFYRYVRSP